MIQTILRNSASQVKPHHLKDIPKQVTYLPQRGIKLMDHHIQLMVSCKGYNCIIASKSTRLWQTGHCMETGKKNEVFMMKSANETWLVFHVAGSCEKHGHASAKASSCQSRELQVNNTQTALGSHHGGGGGLINSFSKCRVSAQLHDTHGVHNNRQRNGNNSH